MALTCDFREIVGARVQRDPDFARALFDQAATLFLNGEPETARMMLRDLVNSTVDFEELAALTDKPAKSLHRMLSLKAIAVWTTSLLYSTCCAPRSTPR